jgi:hypothetical protein
MLEKRSERGIRREREVEMRRERGEKRYERGTK